MNPEKPTNSEELGEKKLEKSPEILTELWTSFDLEEQVLAKAILDGRPPDEDAAVIESDLPPNNAADLLDVNLIDGASVLSRYITRGKGTEVVVDKGKPSIVIDDTNWREHGPRGKWLRKWIPIAESLYQKVEAFKSKGL